MLQIMVVLVAVLIQELDLELLTILEVLVTDKQERLLPHQLLHKDSLVVIV